MMHLIVPGLGLLAFAFASTAAPAAPAYPGTAYDYRSGAYIPAPQIPPPVPYAVPVYPEPPPPAYAEPAPAYAVPVPQPLPYGWVYARPANCGVYRYWDGEECLDARYDPPALED